MIEVEIKARIDDKRDTEKKLKKAGFRPGKTVCEEDLYFNGTERDFRITDEALRIRQTRFSDTGGTLSTLTYKGAKLDSLSQSRVELETGVSDSKASVLIMEALGYKPVFTVKKNRTVLTRGTVTACMDEVEGLGLYLELEELITDDSLREASVKKLYGILSSIQIEACRTTEKSYLEMLLSGQ